MERAHSSVSYKTPCELWVSKQLKFDYFKVFGSTVYVHIPKQNRRKLDQKAIKCLFVGYSENTKSYRVYDPVKNTVKTVCDVIFEKNVKERETRSVDVCKTTDKNISIDESETFVRLQIENEVSCSHSEFNSVSSFENEAHIENKSQEEKESNESILDGTLVNLSSPQSASTSFEQSFIESSVEDDINQTVIENNENSNVNEVTPEKFKQIQCDVTASNIIEHKRLRSNSTSSANIACNSCAFLTMNEEPFNYQQAIKCNDSSEWQKAMNDEYESLMKNHTWILCEPPKGHTIVDNRWVFRIKRNPDNSVDRFKARLVAKGFSQCYGIDYTETFSPVVKFTSIRTLLATAAEYQMSIKQFDVKTAFLYGELEEAVYMRQPIGYSDGSNKVCKLIKSLYGLKQAPRCWNKKFKQFIVDFNFKESQADCCVFIRRNKNEITYLAIFVDDGLIISTNEQHISPVIKHLQTHFEIKVLEAKYFLGFEINRATNGSIHLHQESYCRKVLKKFGFDDSNAVSTPIDRHQTLENKGDECVNFPYREAVGSLIYLSIGTRPDITFAVNYVGRFVEHPSNEHVTAVKRILRYLKGTTNFGIMFSSKNANNFKLSIFSDADYAGCVETRKSTTGYCLLIGTSIVSWCSERQDSVSLSTAESEYIAASQACKELVWQGRLLAELDERFASDLPVLFVDNESAVKLIKNPVFHKRSKHIETRYHYIREKYLQKCFNVNGISTKDQLADIFTKSFPKIRFQDLRLKLNVIPNNV